MTEPRPANGPEPADGPRGGPAHEPADEPEGEHRPFPDPEHSIAPRAPRTIGGAVYLAVLGASAVAVALVALGPWRIGLRLMGAALVCGAVARLVLPNRSAGMLGIRRKFIDVATLALVGGGLVVLSSLIRRTPT